ncbi:hypothetical protein C8Q76DRAFT_463749 [Earliella scabrosa]|nr:hypothetical protein C8Q76DRAFT_463749 [Earliella scabrosa]
MSPPTVEIAFGPAAELARTTPHAQEVKDKFAPLKAAEGLINIHFGLQHEDQKTAYLFAAWESLEAHQRVTADVESFTKFVAGVGTLFDPSQGPPQMFHVKVAHEPYTAFSAPVLDFATFTLLEPEKESRATLEGYMEEIVRTAPRTPEAVGTTWGPVVEKPDTVALFIGWSGVEAHYEVTKTVGETNPELAAVVAKCLAIARMEAVHIPLALVL